MVRLLCCRDNVRKRKKLPGGNRAFPKKGQTIVLALMVAPLARKTMRP
jgi:hypothetical protein